MISPYDHEALWTKAKVFLNRAMDPGPDRSFDEQALWASAALELLGKAALARVSPLLIAEPTETGENVLIACGLYEGAAKFTSVRASTIFKRCERAFQPFRAAEAQKFAEARNEYLHGSGLGLSLPSRAWWPQFWALAVILVDAQDRELDELVGPERVQTVEAHLQERKRNVEERTEALISRARQRLKLYRSGSMPARLQQHWEAQCNPTAGYTYGISAICPACGESGNLEGEEAAQVKYDHEVDNYDGSLVSAWATFTIPSDYFSCSTCHLVLDRLELVKESGLPSSFTVIDDDPEVPEAEYGND